MITPPLEAVWPDVERRLRALLYMRGLDRPSADDVVQEVALRVLDNDVTYDSPGDLLRWAAPVACRLHIDLLRQRARLADPDAVPDRPARDDVAREVADRMELQRAFRGIARLRPADRAAIMDAVSADAAVPATRQEAVRLAVRRHRARHRLTLVLEHLTATVAGVRLLFRDRRSAVLAALVPVAALPLFVTVPHVRPAEAAARPGAAVPPAVTRQHDAEPVRAAHVTRVVNGPTHVAPRPVTRHPGATEREAVKVDTPAGVAVRAGSDRRRHGEPLACLRGVPTPLGRICVL